MWRETEGDCFEDNSRTSLVAQWLRFHTPSAGALGSIPGQAIIFHIPQPNSCAKTKDAPCHKKDLVQININVCVSDSSLPRGL